MSRGLSLNALPQFNGTIISIVCTVGVSTRSGYHTSHNTFPCNVLKLLWYTLHRKILCDVWYLDPVIQNPPLPLQSTHNNNSMEKHAGIINVYIITTSLSP